MEYLITNSQRTNFVTMKIVNAIKDIVKGKKEFVELGNIPGKKRLGTRKDYVYGMWLMMQMKNLVIMY